MWQNIVGFAGGRDHLGSEGGLSRGAMVSAPAHGGFSTAGADGSTVVTATPSSLQHHERLEGEHF